MVFPKMSKYVKKFKIKIEDENNKLMSFCIDNEKLLEKWKTVWTKVEDLKNIEMKALPFYKDICIKTKKWRIVIKFILHFILTFMV